MSGGAPLINSILANCLKITHKFPLNSLTFDQDSILMDQ